MRIGTVEVSFHRTVRVANGRTPSNLPPSLGRANLQKVSNYQSACPETWDSAGYFIPLHDTEALWISFHASTPSAIIVGAGGVNALTGDPLGTKLETGNYMVAPPQPWIDGWKSKDDGCVYQFVATPYQDGKGLSVGEQILGDKSETGGIGIAVFDSKQPLTTKPRPTEGLVSTAYAAMACSAPPVKSLSVTRGVKMTEMGVGKGGKITQKIYPDPHGIEVWKDSPAEIAIIYLVNAETYAEITGVTIPKPATHNTYDGAWYNLQDEQEGDVQGSSAFTNLKSVFPGDTENI